jgi:hypothetical protein
MRQNAARRERTSASALAFERRCLRSSVLFALLCLSGLVAAADWQSTISKDPPGKFPPLRSLRARYSFGWSGITAATGDARFTSSDNRNLLDASGRTIGFVRALWRFEVNHHAVADAPTLRPIETKQIETTRGKTVTTNLAFNNAGVLRSRTDNPAKVGAGKAKRFDFPNLFDLQAGALYLRSQSLADHSVYRIVVYPATNAYLATITVAGRERISVRAGSYNAIKLDLQLSRVGDRLDLQPHRKFRRATVWVSDDSDRVVLRVEAQIFVGTVFAELQSVQFEAPR